MVKDAHGRDPSRPHLGEVCLLTSDVVGLAAFYRMLLDLDEPEDADDPVHQHVVTKEPMLTVHDDGQSHVTALSSVRLAFTVADVGAEHERLLGHGVRIVQPPMRQPWGATNLVLADPDGNLITLRSRP